MRTMVEVLRLDFAGGRARDVSGYSNHGSVVGAVPATTDRDRPAGLHFDGVDDRVVIRPSRCFEACSGLWIDTRLRLASLRHRSTIAEGYLSFAFAVDPDGSLVGDIYSGNRWYNVQSPADLVTVDRWHDVTFAQLPPDTLALLVDGRVVARIHTYFGQVGEIQWPYGLNIGGWPDADVRMLNGDVDRFRVRALARPRLRPPATDGQY